MKRSDTINDAKQLAVKYRRRGVIILAFGNTDYLAASYGMTRHDCDSMKLVLDDIIELIDDGTVDIPPGYGNHPGTVSVELVNENLLCALQKILDAYNANPEPIHFAVRQAISDGRKAVSSAYES